jgi:hypothetical protein
MHALFFCTLYFASHIVLHFYFTFSEIMQGATVVQRGLVVCCRGPAMSVGSSLVTVIIQEELKEGIP